MKVKGIEIPLAVQEAAVAVMKTKHSFTAFNVTSVVAQHMGVKTSDEIAYRTADRIIQRERKAGNIGPSDSARSRSSYWKWIGK